MTKIGMDLLSQCFFNIKYDKEGKSIFYCNVCSKNTYNINELDGHLRLHDLEDLQSDIIHNETILSQKREYVQRLEKIKRDGYD